MVKLTRRAWGHFGTLNKVKTPRQIAFIQPLATHEYAHPVLWSMRELKVLLLFHKRDVGPFHSRPQGKKHEKKRKWSL